jgi:gas vesicle protein
MGRNLEESREEGETILREGADAFNKQTRRVGSDIQKEVQEVGETAQKLAALAQDTADESGKELQDFGRDVGQNIQEVEQEGEKLIRKGGEAVSEQVNDCSFFLVARVLPISSTIAIGFVGTES